MLGDSPSGGGGRGDPTAEVMGAALLGGRAMNVPEGSCGRCDAYQEGLCVERNMAVGPADPGCLAFIDAGG